jgi:hypothetical protein
VGYTQLLASRRRQGCSSRQVRVTVTVAASGVTGAAPTPTRRRRTSSHNNYINTCQLFFYTRLIHCFNLLTAHLHSTMEGGYSFAEGGPIPYGDPQSQSYTANVSRSLHRHERQTPHAHPTRETAAQQPATNDLSQTFRPRFEDGSEIKLEFMPSLARRADQDLLDYLQKRKISFHFLNDIDDFLKRHPALLKACPSWCYQLSTLPPLEAYLFFVKGYLRPARYVDGVSIEKHYTVTLLTYIFRLFQLPRMSRFLFIQSHWSITHTILNSTITSQTLVNVWKS